jgi:hypothetical protein
MRVSILGWLPFRVLDNGRHGQSLLLTRLGHGANAVATDARSLHSPSRLLKKAHLRRWRAWALVAAYRKYASLGPSRSALHLDLFEQPDPKRVFSILLAAIFVPRGVAPTPDSTSGTSGERRA